MIKRILVLLSCILMLVFFCGARDNMIIYSNHEIIANNVVGEVSRELSKRYDLIPMGFGGRIHEDVEKLALSFTYCGEMGIDEYRKLIIHCSEYFLEKINSNEALKPHLHNYPFDANNIDLCIFIHTKENERVNIGEITYVDVVKGKVRYTVRESEYGLKKLLAEDYDEARKIVHGEGEVEL